MLKPKDARELAQSLTGRSDCTIKVAAVLVDRFGVFSWGWNSAGSTGYGEHAEAAAIRRANKKRLRGSIVYVAGRRGNQIYSRPCEACERLLKSYKVSKAVYTNSDGGWEEWEL